MNTYSTTRKQFELLSETLENQLLDLKGSSRLSLLETDLIKETLRELYRTVDQLGKEAVLPSVSESGFPSSQPLADKMIPVENSVNIPHITKDLIEAVSLQAPIIMEIEVPVQEVLVAASLQETAPTKATPSEIVISTFQPALQATRKSVYEETTSKTPLGNENITVGSKYSASETLYDRIAQTPQETRLSDQLQRKSLDDLRVSIGLNERFTFINSLFNGDQKSFYGAIDTLNSATSYSSAQVELENLQATYGWNRTDSHLIELSELVKRRFGI